MIKKSIVAIMVIVAAAAIVFAASGDPDKNDSINHEQSVSTDNHGTSDNSGASDDNSSQNKISAEDAKKIAQKYIEEPGTNAGKPKLIKTGGRYMYVVPVMENGTNVGEINIDAITGKNVGGAGGAP